MATKKKMLQAAAGNAGGAGLDITEVFSTYLYTGTGSNHYLAMDDVDVYNEGGLYWSKGRSAGVSGGNGRHFMVAKPSLGSSEIAFYNDATSSTNAATTEAEGTWMQSDGTQFISGSGINTNGTTYASWTWRKAPKFFDVGTISFDGSGVGSYSHNLGVTPAVVIFKLTNTTGDWFVWHKDLTSQNYAMFLNATAASSNQGGWATYTDTAVSFDSSLFANDTAVVYLFAHNDGDGEFGPSGDQDIIKCGSYTGNGSTNGPEIDLGFEPQWVLIKRTDSVAGWVMFDNMRGMVVGGNDSLLQPNNSDAENTGLNAIAPQATGFQIESAAGTYNASGGTYIYMAIRRGPLAQPESGTEVFAIDTATQDSTAETHALSYYDSGWFLKRTGGDAAMSAQRILPNRISFQTGQYASLYWDAGFDNNQGKYFAYNSDPTVNYFLKRAPGFFDHLVYAGTGSVNTHQHNLTVQPEMMWVRRLNTSSADAMVYHKDLSADVDIRLNGNTPATDTTIWNNTRPTDTVFTVGTSGNTNDGGTGEQFYAMLFASIAGVSKVGSYTGNGAASQNIYCGFTSGARFVLLKRTTTGTNYNSNWLVWDTVRGIVSGNDPLLFLTATQTEITDEDFIDPYNAGFTILDNGTSGANVSGASYIFYAIA